jgi:hypothetical protein
MKIKHSFFRKREDRLNWPGPFKRAFLTFLTKVGEPHASCFHTTHRHWYHCLFGHHTRWQIFLTNTLKWPQRKHDFKVWWKTQPWKKKVVTPKESPGYVTMPSFPPQEAIPILFGTGPNAVDPDCWKRKEMGLGFNPSLELKLLKDKKLVEALTLRGWFNKRNSVESYRRYLKEKIDARNRRSHKRTSRTRG